MRITVLFATLMTFTSGAHAAAPEDEARRADNTLNATYQLVMQQLGTDKKEALRNAQRAWISFRDSACSFESSLKRDGQQKDWIEQQTNPAMDGRCVQRLTLERVADLQRYLQYLKQNAAPAVNPAVKQSAAQVAGCRLDTLPANFTVQAVGVYEGGIDTDVQLDESGHETKSVEVIVNRPGENIVLVLMAYDPVLWQLKRSSGSNIVAVLVGGYHAQAVLGIERSIPLMISSYSGRKDCGQSFYAYEAGQNLLQANTIVKNLTGREIDKLWSSYTGNRVHVGSPPPRDANLVSSEDYKPEDYTDLPRFPSGQKGIDRLIEQGLLRRATAADLDAWVEKASAQYRKFNQELKVDRPFGPQGTYVVLGKITFPTGLYGGHSVAFLIPAGVPLPAGNPGHSAIYFLEDGTCRGPVCREP